MFRKKSRTKRKFNNKLVSRVLGRILRRLVLRSEENLASQVKEQEMFSQMVEAVQDSK